MPYLAKIYIYPIKSLDPVEVTTTAVLASGALAGDRLYAMVDDGGQFINAKRTAKIHHLRSQFDLATHTVQISHNQATHSFNLISDPQALADYMTSFLGIPVRLVKNLEMGFPDDPIACGPTLVSTATLLAVQSWYPELEQIHRRFRTNLEIAEMPAFGEDQLCGAKGEPRKFQLGNIDFWGINPCARCVVPTRDPDTGAVYPNFQKIFSQNRQASLPSWAERSQFNHFYRLTLNTKIAQISQNPTLQVGDRLRQYP